MSFQGEDLLSHNPAEVWELEDGGRGERDE